MTDLSPLLDTATRTMMKYPRPASFSVTHGPESSRICCRMEVPQSYLVGICHIGSWVIVSAFWSGRPKPQHGYRGALRSGGQHLLSLPTFSWSLWSSSSHSCCVRVWSPLPSWTKGIWGPHRQHTIILSQNSYLNHTWRESHIFETIIQHSTWWIKSEVKGKEHSHTHWRGRGPGKAWHRFIYSSLLAGNYKHTSLPDCQLSA